MKHSFRRCATSFFFAFSSRVLIFGGVPFCASAADSTGLQLAIDGKAQAILVVSEKPSAAARMAVKIVGDHLFQITGARFRVVSDSDWADATVENGRILPPAESAISAETNLILIGESRLTGLLGVSTEGLGPGGLRIRTFPNALVLLGPDAATPSDLRGTQYAATAFLEDVLGCRFLWPGELGKIVPRNPNLTIPAIDRSETPLLRQRNIRSLVYGDRDALGLKRLGVIPEDYHRLRASAEATESEDGGWFVWHRLGGSLGLASGHAFGDAWEKHGREHPEWFAMQPNGSRDMSKLGPERSQFCVSNPELIETIAKEKIEALNKQNSPTGLKSVSIGPNDGGQATFCMCPECKKLDPPEGEPITLLDNTGPNGRTSFEYVSLTDRYVWFWNEIAKRVTAVHPEAWLTADAYSVYTAPPLNHQLHPNLAIRFVDISYLSDEDRRIGRARWDAWAKMASKLYFRPNLLLAGRRQGTPAIYVHKFAEDFRYLASHSMIGTDFDAVVHNWATQGLNYYVAARLHWDPELDVDAVIDDYCRSGFGSAAGDSIKRYFLRIEALTSEIAAAEPPLEPTVPYTPEVIAELRTILDEADRRAGKENGDPAIEKRIAFLRRGLEYTAVHAEAYRLLAEFDAGDRRLTPELKAQVKEVLDRNWAISRDILLNDFLAVNVSMVAWGGWGNFNRLGWKEPVE